MGVHYNFWISIGIGVNFFLSLLLNLYFWSLSYFTPFRGVLQLSSLIKFSAIILRLISQWIHRLCCCDPTSDILGGTLLCQPLLCGIQIHIHWSRHCRSSEWDTINVFPPNMPDLALLCLYLCRPCRPPYLLLYLSSSEPIILNIFSFPHFLASLPNLFWCCLNVCVEADRRIIERPEAEVSYAYICAYIRIYIHIYMHSESQCSFSFE